MHDLLSKDYKTPLELKDSKDSGVYVKGLTAIHVKGTKELQSVLDVGRWMDGVWCG